MKKNNSRKKLFDVTSIKNANSKPFAASIFCGAISSKEDALVIQKKLRNEWK